jgi:hypothetical protein
VITIGATGHQNIPYEAVTFVEEGIANVISHADQQPTGVSLLAAGAGQLFAKALLGAGGRLHVILPCYGYEKTFSQQTDLDCLLALLQKADTIETLDNPFPSEDAFLEAG